MSRQTVFKLICLLVPAVVGMAGIEWHYRVHRTRDYWTKAQLLSNSPAKRFPFTFDTELGFRPEFQGGRYTETGTVANDYPHTKRPEVERVLFVGDSATARGQIVGAVRRLAGDERFEFWNAGVDGFDTSQERAYYARYNAVLEPDHVVLVLHNNDFTSQPVLDADNTGAITFFAPGEMWRVPLPWLARRSEFVRRKLAQVWLDRREATGYQRVERELAALANRLAADGCELSIVVLPILRPYAEWTDAQRTNRQWSLKICAHQGLRTFDVLPAVELAVSHGVDPCETPGDLWHPGDAGAAYIAAQLVGHGLLSPSSAPPPPLELAGHTDIAH